MQRVSERGDFVRPAIAAAQLALILIALYAFGRLRGYGDASALFVLAGLLVGVGGWIAYYSQVSVFGRYVSPGEPRQGPSAWWLSTISLVLMATGVGVGLWTVLVVGRA